MKRITMAFFMLLNMFLFAQDGILDPAFGTNGFVLVTNDDGAAFGKSVQPDGTIIYIQGNKFRRLNANGTPDTGFGVLGAITISQPGTFYQGFLVSNDQITLISKTASEQYRMGRYNFDGSVDATLGASGEGYVSIDVGDIEDGVNPEWSADHKLLLGGNDWNPFNYNNYFVRKYNSNGTNDTSFNSLAANSGINVSENPNGSTSTEYHQDLDVMSDGRVIISGYSVNVESASIMRASFAIIPAKFSGAAVVRTQNHIMYRGPKADLALDQNDNIYLLGGQISSVWDLGAPENVIQKYTASGNPANSFGTSSVLTIELIIDATTKADFRKILVQPDGKLLLAGMTSKTNALSVFPSLILARYLQDGTLDTTFGTNGYLLHDIAHPNTAANFNDLTRMFTSADYSSIYLCGNNQQNAVVLKFGNISMSPLVVPEFTAVAPICSGETLQALPTTSNNDVSGTWSPAMNNTATTTYTFTPNADEHAAIATLTITVNQPTISSVTEGVCESYTWADNGTTYTSGGIYTNVTTNAEGCTHTATLNLVINQAAILSGESNQTFVLGATLASISVSPSTVTWYASEAQALVSANPLEASLPLVHDTTYFAVHTTAQGCASVPFPVTVSVTLGTATFESAGFSVYPNPTSGIVFMKYSKRIENVSVVNLLGQVVISNAIHANEARIDISNLSSGTYFLKFESDNTINTVKIIKQ